MEQQLRAAIPDRSVGTREHTIVTNKGVTCALIPGKECLSSSRSSLCSVVAAAARLPPELSPIRTTLLGSIPEHEVFLALVRESRNYFCHLIIQ